MLKNLFVGLSTACDFVDLAHYVSASHPSIKQVLNFRTLKRNQRGGSFLPVGAERRGVSSVAFSPPMLDVQNRGGDPEIPDGDPDRLAMAGLSGRNVRMFEGRMFMLSCEIRLRTVPKRGRRPPRPVLLCSPVDRHVL